MYVLTQKEKAQAQVKRAAWALCIIAGGRHMWGRLPRKSGSTRARWQPATYRPADSTKHAHARLSNISSSIKFRVMEWRGREVGFAGWITQMGIAGGYTRRESRVESRRALRNKRE